MLSDYTTLPAAELKRVARQTILPGHGLREQERLHEAHVLVIGAGGLGCPLMQSLAAAGVGHISVIDDDTVDITNIHRQILFGASDVGRAKVDVAGARLRELQPGLRFSGLHGRFGADNAAELLEGVDVLIDGSDTFATKFLAADAAEATGTPLVWGSVLRYRGDVAVWWSGSTAEPDGRGVGMRDLYPSQPDPDSVPDCATAGVLGVTTSVVAGLMATETIKFLRDPSARVQQVGKLHIYDALSASIQHFNVTADPQRQLVTKIVTTEASDCAVEPSSSEVETGEANSLLHDLESGTAIAIDVREPGEKAIKDLPTFAIHPGYHLPTSVWSEQPELAEQLLGSIGAEEPNADVVIYCASGKRSASFVERFEKHAAGQGVHLHNLPGGANEHGVEI
ncbi:ThiF family adenylyltransferase [uncultured Corynebacterium sp.]|uniref:ThiF family adenylyltransferase n=1 Tax=uncultured Corynebacterium sp. TaxID=159447 RepID=UPI0025DECED4|nr:ThiF family adenylyltransferase [uncultured Corynebacterium sp.]